MVHQNKRPTIPTSASSLVAQSRTECSIPDLQSLCRDEAVAMISGEAFENRRRQGLCAIRLAPLILAAQTPSRSQNKDPQLEKGSSWRMGNGNLKEVASFSRAPSSG